MGLAESVKGNPDDCVYEVDVSVHEKVQELQARVQRQIVGQSDVVERLILALLADGNVLVEGLPGLAKTRAIKSIASSLEAGLSRIQFTPDLLPSDVTGTDIYYTEDGKGVFKFQPGPIFNNLILADEINRAPAKVQAALLEAMEERTVTVAGNTHALPELFMVMATQNPVEQEGTYPLPEAQLDRFLMHIFVDYPEEASEIEIMRLNRAEQKGHAKTEPPIPAQVIFDARKEIGQVKISENIEQYIVDLVFATRYPERYGDKLGSWIEVGSSPRATIALDRCARVRAWMKSRDYVTPDDVRAVAHSVLRHRLILAYEANATGVTANDVVDEILSLVAIA